MRWREWIETGSKVSNPYNGKNPDFEEETQLLLWIHFTPHTVTKALHALMHSFHILPGESDMNAEFSLYIGGISGSGKLCNYFKFTQLTEPAKRPLAWKPTFTNFYHAYYIGLLWDGPFVA